MCSFCIIEGPETLRDFVQMEQQEIQDNIKSRRNKIFLLMEEVHLLIFQCKEWDSTCLNSSDVFWNLDDEFAINF